MCDQTVHQDGAGEACISRLSLFLPSKAGLHWWLDLEQPQPWGSVPTPMFQRGLISGYVCRPHSGGEACSRIEYGGGCSGAACNASKRLLQLSAALHIGILTVSSHTPLLLKGHAALRWHSAKHVRLESVVPAGMLE
jgi:hypothetical protein